MNETNGMLEMVLDLVWWIIVVGIAVFIVAPVGHHASFEDVLVSGLVSAGMLIFAFVKDHFGCYRYSPIPQKDNKKH